MLRKIFYSKICLLFIIIFLLIPVNTSAQDIIKLETRLVSMPKNLPDCGEMMVRAVMAYEVLNVLEGDYKEKQIHVVHGCPEMSRKMFSPDSGNVEKFVIGDRHILWVQLLSPDKYGEVFNALEYPNAILYESLKVNQATSAVSSPELLRLPVIRLHYGLRIFNGVEGSYCWPTVISEGEVLTQCVDKLLAVPSEVISVTKGDALVVQIDAQEPPSNLIARVFPADNISSTEKMSKISLDAALTAPLTINLPAGVYIVQISGKWSRGDIIYIFKMAVSTKELNEPGNI